MRQQLGQIQKRICEKQWDSTFLAKLLTPYNRQKGARAYRHKSENPSKIRCQASTSWGSQIVAHNLVHTAILLSCWQLGKRICLLTSNPWSLPMSIISLALFGTTCMIWIAYRRLSISTERWALSVYLYTSRSNSWYFIILCTGLISKSHNCNLCPSFCLKSW